jgi:ribosomal protein S18 acetylase RimI-like enzyme
VEGRTVAYSCYGHIAGTDAGFDLFWIATHNDLRGSGIGKILLEETHKKAKEMGARYIIAETSSLEKYLPTRLFYEKNGYSKDAFIADYYKPGDGKVIYVKRL